MMCCLLCAVFFLFGGVASAAPEGCVAVSSQPCEYVATAPGGFRAVGDNWGVEIVRDNRTLTFAFPSKPERADVIRPGDRVRAWAGLRVKGSLVDQRGADAGLVRVGSDPSRLR